MLFRSQRINRAIELAGPLPTLLDTRAVVYTRMGRSDDAIPELEKILAETKAGSAGFHLCQALLASKRWSAARSAYERLRSSPFQPDQLDPLERPMWEQFEKEMRSRW